MRGRRASGLPYIVADYAAIADLHALAFGQRAFDPELSLVAELEGQVVEHVLFSPHWMRLLDQTVPSARPTWPTAFDLEQSTIAAPPLRGYHRAVPHRHQWSMH